MTTYPVLYGDIDAYRAWSNRRVAPAYLRGLPSWMWQTAARGRQRPGRRAPGAT